MLQGPNYMQNEFQKAAATLRRGSLAVAAADKHTQIHFMKTEQ